MLPLLALAAMTIQPAPDLNWMAGQWSGAVWGGRMEEHWTTQEGGSLLGMNRVVKDGKTVHKEFIWIEVSEAGTTLNVQVFRDPVETVPYKLIRVEKNLAIFSNPQHARLTTMTYRRTGAELSITLEGTRKEQPYKEEIKLTKS
jgi:hypothetical protein